MIHFLEKDNRYCNMEHIAFQAVFTLTILPLEEIFLNLSLINLGNKWEKHHGIMFFLFIKI